MCHANKTAVEATIGRQVEPNSDFLNVGFVKGKVKTCTAVPFETNTEHAAVGVLVHKQKG